MRVGIMTMHRVPNYGSFMQAYSLKTMLENLGHEVIFVDYHLNPDVEHRDDPIEAAKCGIRSVERCIKGTSAGHILRKLVGRRTDQDKAIMFSCNELLGVTESYRYRVPCDALVVGSDEVFNCLQLGGNVGFSPELFGANAKAHHVISYAASFGNTTLEKLKRYGVEDEIAGYLNNFEALSVRDQNSAEIVFSLLGENPLIHLDPVLVGGVENKHWRSCDRGDYIILYGYSMRFKEAECRLIKAFAHERGLKVIAVGEDQLIRDAHLRCRPDEVLPLFAQASGVVTDTFHGTIFSVITHRPFVTLPRGDVNGQGGNMQKLTYLLRELGLENRMTTSLKGLSELMDTPIDYSAVDKVRSYEAERSLAYLRKQLTNDCGAGDCIVQH